MLRWGGPAWVMPQAQRGRAGSATGMSNALRLIAGGGVLPCHADRCQTRRLALFACLTIDSSVIDDAWTESALIGSVMIDSPWIGSTPGSLRRWQRASRRCPPRGQSSDRHVHPHP